ncbi:hypothetical protein F511_30645 [Dorcoceras hygrometricum]|uniref:Uncharacterized protein n=1 Tax=Dorcoceras hygrometricum TaxID=472368 RepID=A0A2Z7AF88_9LAMI|nr:hypothetical protein F511_30645 [Dorcoceras hygrometricum]
MLVPLYGIPDRKSAMIPIVGPVTWGRCQRALPQLTLALTQPKHQPNDLRAFKRCRKPSAVSSEENVRCEFIYGSSELNLLHLPFFHNGNDPLEDFDYSDPRCNPLLRPAATRTPSNTTAHQAASCVCLTHLFYVSVRKATYTSLTSQVRKTTKIVCDCDSLTNLYSSFLEILAVF